MSKTERLNFLQKEYVDNKKSFCELAEVSATYPNKLRRDAKYFGLRIRNKSEAQTAVLKSGRANHPTKGQKRPETTRIKISESKAAAWKGLSEEDREAFAATAKENWENRSIDDKKEFRRKAAQAVRQAAEQGSKLEKYLLGVLNQAGYHTQFHKEHLLVNERLQIDLFVPKLNVAIEVDGPSHFLPIWGQKTLQRNQKSDAQKNGLLLGKGLIIVRVRYQSALSHKNKRDISNKLLSLIKQIETKRPPVGERYFEL